MKKYIVLGMLLSSCVIKGAFFGSIEHAFKRGYEGAKHTVEHHVVDPIVHTAKKTYSATVDGVKYVGDSVEDLANKAFNIVAGGVETAVNQTVNGVNTAVDQVSNTANDVADKAADEAQKAAVVLHIKNPKGPNVKEETLKALRKDVADIKAAHAFYSKLFQDHGRGSLNDLGAFLKPVYIKSQMAFHSKYFVNALLTVLPKLSGIYGALNKNYPGIGSAWHILKCPNGGKCANILANIPKVGNTIADKMIEAFEAKIKETEAK